MPFPPRVASLLDAAPHGLHVRSATDSDLAFLRVLYGHSRADELSAVPWPRELREQFLDSQFALQHAHYVKHFADADFLLVERNGAPIGRFYIGKRSSALHIIDISLLDSERNKGWGAALIRSLMNSASRRGMGVTLHVNRFNPRAYALYRRLGFVESGSPEETYLPMRWIS